MLKIKYCDKCPLAIFNNFVPVSGKLYGIDIMIIGEAPGATEVRRGEVALGKSGKLLKKMLRRYKLLDKCYITNVVKCKPPGNRAPRPTEIAACKPYLLTELKRVKPKLILLMGLTAINTFLPNEKYVKNKAYTFQRYGSIVIGCSYHPSYILRNKQEEVRFNKFFDNASKIYQHFNPYYNRPL